MENNIFVNCKRGLHVDARALGWAHYHADEWIKEESEKGTLSGIAYDKPPYSERYPELANIMQGEPKAPEGNRITNPVLRENELLDDRQDYIKYFLPYNGSEINQTLTANTSSPQLIFSVQDGVTRQLTTASSSTQVNRYVDASLDERKTIEQLRDFYHFFTWFALITMIVCVMLGVGVIF